MAFNFDIKKLKSKRGCMGGSSPSMPEPAPATPPPKPIEQSDPEVAAKEEEARVKNDKRAKLAKGRGSSILTTPFGDQTQAEVQKTNLLGQGTSTPNLASVY